MTATRLTYVHVAEVVAGQFSIIGNHLTHGLPSLTAVCGFGRALALRLSQSFAGNGFNGEDSAVQDAATLLAVHVPSPQLGCPRFVRYEKPVGPRNQKTGGVEASMHDERKGNAIFDIVIALEHVDTELDAEVVNQCVRSLRFAGAELRSVDGGAPRVLLHTDHLELFRHIPSSAWVLEDARAAVQAWCAGTGASMDEALVTFLARGPRKHAKAPESQHEEGVAGDEQEAALLERPAGYFVPVSTGYVLLESPRLREGTRQPGVPHAFAEPVLGLARARQAASVRAQYRRIARAQASGQEDAAEDPPHVFWSMRASGRLIVASATELACADN